MPGVLRYLACWGDWLFDLMDECDVHHSHNLTNFSSSGTSEGNFLLTRGRRF